MGENSKIEWTDHTWNPWRGCAHAVLADGTPHPGCDHCYAEALAKRNPSTLGTWGEAGIRVVGNYDYLRLPHTWNEQSRRDGVRRRVFCASLADFFEDYAGPIYNARGVQVFHFDHHHVSGQHNPAVTLQSLRREVIGTIRDTPWLDWIILTKRPGVIPLMLPCRHGIDWLETPINLGGRHQGGRDYCDGCYSNSALRVMHQRLPNNTIVMTSVSHQKSADQLVAHLIQCLNIVPRIGLSCEPLLGPIDLQRASCGDPHAISWVIVGGESGPHARPMQADWARDLRDQCQRYGIPFFFKQWGEFGPDGSKVGKAAAGHVLDGQIHQDFPDFNSAAEE